MIFDILITKIFFSLVCVIILNFKFVISQFEIDAVIYLIFFYMLKQS